MVKKKNAGFYARGAVSRRSADRKAGHALRLFLKEESENETLFWKCHNYGDNFDGPCPAGRRHSLQLYMELKNIWDLV